MFARCTCTQLCVEHIGWCDPRLARFVIYFLRARTAKSGACVHVCCRFSSEHVPACVNGVNTMQLRNAQYQRPSYGGDLRLCLMQRETCSCVFAGARITYQRQHVVRRTCVFVCIIAVNHQLVLFSSLCWNNVERALKWCGNMHLAQFLCCMHFS